MDKPTLLRVPATEGALDAYRLIEGILRDTIVKVRADPEHLGRVCEALASIAAAAMTTQHRIACGMDEDEARAVALEQATEFVIRYQLAGLDDGAVPPDAPPGPDGP